jgi:dihydroorotase
MTGRATPRMVLLRGGRLLDPSQNIDETGDLLLADGAVEAVGRVGEVRRDGDELETIDCAGRVVSPGFIDVHCHLREPGREEVETIASGARAAAAGGFTAVCAMPNTDPVTDNQAAVGFILAQARRAAAARVYPIGAISIGEKGETLAEFGEMVGAGAVAVSDDGKPVVSAQLMRTALEYARTFGIPVADHCEEPTLAAGGAMNEGLVSARLGLRGIPSDAEEIMAIRDILLARRTGGHVHLCHMSTRGSVELIRWGKERGIDVTAEVCPHHLSLTEERVEGYDTNAKMNPPLRTAEDVAALQEAVADGTIDLVATDHAPHPHEDKDCEWAAAAFGMLGLETALSVVQETMVDPGLLDWAGVADRMSHAPARIGRVHDHGQPLDVGQPANLVLYDPSVRRVVDASESASLSRNTPYAGRELPGQVVATFLRGRATVLDGKLQ